MSRLLTLLIALAVLIAAYMMLRNLENRPESDPKTKVTNDPAIESPAMISNQTASNFHDWREFASKSGDFKVLLPSLPQRRR